MPLLTKILKPDEFEAAHLGEFFATALSLPSVFTNPLAHHVIEQLQARGIISKTEVLKPSEFNSTTIAVLINQRIGGGWETLEENLRMQQVDRAQYILDALVAAGILG